MVLKFKDRGKSYCGCVLKFLKCPAKVPGQMYNVATSVAAHSPSFQKMRNHATQLRSYRGIWVISRMTRVALEEVISVLISSIRKTCMRIDLNTDVILSPTWQMTLKRTGVLIGFYNIICNAMCHCVKNEHSKLPYHNIM